MLGRLRLFRRIGDLEERVEGLEHLLADQRERKVGSVEMVSRDPRTLAAVRRVQAEASTPAPDGQY